MNLSPEVEAYLGKARHALEVARKLQAGGELVTLESLSPYIGPHILKEVEYASLAA
jgi:hypothetical protein